MNVIVTGGNGRVGKAVAGSQIRLHGSSRGELRQPVMEQAEAIVHVGEIPSARSGHSTEEEVFGANGTVGSLVM